MHLNRETSRYDDGVVRFLLVALEPRSYAHALGLAIAEMRPRLEVLVAEPEELPAGGELWAPALVLCGESRPDGCDEEIRWAQFSPYDEPEVLRVDGLSHNIPGLGLADLLELVDLHCEGGASRLA